MTIKTLNGVKKLLETRILEYKKEIKSENVRNDKDLHNLVNGELLVIEEIYETAFGKEEFDEFIKRIRNGN